MRNAPAYYCITLSALPLAQFSYDCDPMENILISALLLKLSFVIINLLVQSKCQGSLIVKEPLSLLVPVNKRGEFTCKARCVGFPCSGHWIIDGEQQHEVSERGMMSKFSHSQSENEYTLTLTVNVSEPMNNISIQCRYAALSGEMNQISDSTTVYLLVMSNSPVSPNPSISKNATNFKLLWSPPFLWPGQRIQYYNITMTNDGNGDIAHHVMVNTTSTNPLIEVPFRMSPRSFQWSLNTPNVPSCITFSISPVVDGTASESELIQTVNISDWVWTVPSIPGSEFTVSAANISVLFKADGTPALVEVYIQMLRTICVFSELNYTLIFEDKQGNVIADINTLPNPDSGVIRENIKLYLKENHEYSLKLRVTSQSQTAVSQKHVFYTHLISTSTSSTCNSSKNTTSKTDPLLLYVTLTGVFGTLILALLVAFLVVIVYLCIHRRKRVAEIKLNESKNRVCNVMVNNPIYAGDGPVYESVQIHFEGNHETELNTLQSEDTTDQQYDNLRLSLNDTARYVDQPAQLHYLYTNTASNCNSGNASINRSASVSTARTTARVMAMKKNGQERNKLHLTLSIGGNDSISPESIPTGCAVAPEDVEEPYTVMSPTGGIMP